MSTSADQQLPMQPGPSPQPLVVKPHLVQTPSAYILGRDEPEDTEMFPDSEKVEPTRRVLRNWSQIMRDKQLVKHLEKDGLLDDYRGHHERHVSTQDKTVPMKKKILHFIHSRPVQLIIFGLVLLDALVIVAEIVLQMDDAGTKLEIRQEQLSFIGDYILRRDRNSSHMLARASCLGGQSASNSSHSSSGGGGDGGSGSGGSSNNEQNPWLITVSKHERHDQLPRLVLGIKRLTHLPEPAPSLALCPWPTFWDRVNTNSPQPYCLPEVKNASGVKASVESKMKHWECAEEEETSGDTCENCVSDRELTLRRRASVYEALDLALNWVSLIILGVLVVEVITLIVCTGCPEFLKEKLEVLDAAIIITSFIVDILTIVFPEVAQTSAIIILLLGWRIVRLVNGLMVEEKQRYETRIHAFQFALKRANNKSKKDLDKRKRVEHMALALLELARKLGATEEQLVALEEHVRKRSIQNEEARAEAEMLARKARGEEEEEEEGVDEPEGPNGPKDESRVTFTT